MSRACGSRLIKARFLQHWLIRLVVARDLFAGKHVYFEWKSGAFRKAIFMVARTDFFRNLQLVVMPSCICQLLTSEETTNGVIINLWGFSVSVAVVENMRAEKMRGQL